MSILLKFFLKFFVKKEGIYLEILLKGFVWWVNDFLESNLSNLSLYFSFLRVEGLIKLGFWFFFVGEGWKQNVWYHKFMVFILDGCSFHVAHVWCKQGLFPKKKSDLTTLSM